MPQHSRCGRGLTGEKHDLAIVARKNLGAERPPTIEDGRPGFATVIGLIEAGQYRRVRERAALEHPIVYIVETGVFVRFGNAQRRGQKAGT